MLLLPFYIFSLGKTIQDPLPNILYHFLLLAPCLGLIFFGITLHYGNANVMVLSEDNGEMRDVKIEDLEIKSQKTFLRNHSENV